MSELMPVILALTILIGGVAGAAVLTWFERRLLGVWQDRYGPNRLGPFGIGQVAADMIKLLFKDDWVPPFADKLVFIFAPTAIVVAMMMGFAVVPFAPGMMIIDVNIGLLFFLGMTSLAVYSVLLGGLASNNKYALLGGLRSAAQMVSYEVFMGLSLIGVVMMSGSFSLVDIVEAQTDVWFCFSQILGLFVFIIAGIAESHRLPFDLPEAEAELVAGYQTEYSGMMYAMFWLGEYANILLMCAMGSILFLGGWLSPLEMYPFNLIPSALWLIFKILFLFILFALVKAIVPRYRYDQLMKLGWKIFLPLSLFWVVLTSSYLFYFNLLPVN